MKKHSDMLILVPVFFVLGCSSERDPVAPKINESRTLSVPVEAVIIERLCDGTVIERIGGGTH